MSGIIKKKMDKNDKEKRIVKMNAAERKKLKLYKNKAQNYLNNKKKASDLYEKAMKKADRNKGLMQEAMENFQLLLSIFHDWINGSYREVPMRSLIAIIAAIIYFVSPIDAMFDWIPVAGLLDDATVAGFVIASLRKDFLTYKEWKQEDIDNT